MGYNFNNVKSIGYYTNGEQIENSLISWLDWAFLGIGAFSNVTAGFLDVAGNSLNVLRAVDDARYGPPGTVWQSMRSQWVWETGSAYSVQPTPANGIAVNGVAAPTNSFYVNYPEGRIVFASPVPPTALVTANYSNRYVQIHKSSSPWFQDLQFRSFRNDEPDLDTFAANRVQMPCIVVERICKVETSPLEMGSTASRYRHDFYLHCLGESERDCGRQHDILVNQYDNSIPGYDSNAIQFPLDQFGSPVAGAMTYPQLAAAAPWRHMWIKRVGSHPRPYVNNKFFWATVKYELEIYSF